MQPASSKALRLEAAAFLLEETDRIFTPEQFTDEHRAIARTTEEFWNKEVVPNLEAIQHQEPGVAVRVSANPPNWDLTAVLVPEQYGGMEMDLVSAMIVAEGIAKDGSYAAWHGAHAGIGTLPLLLFGTEEQKQRYLPKLASGEWIGAYCLTEPHAGSDALAAKTRADLSAGRHALHPQRPEDVDHQRRRGRPVHGVRQSRRRAVHRVPGRAGVARSLRRRRRKEDGHQRQLHHARLLRQCSCPVENVLGEIGRGHIIAFNILNLGRLKLGPFAVGGAKAVLQQSLKYAKERKAFGKSIAEFGMIQHKLAEMAIRIYAAETMSYRVAGVIQDRLVRRASRC